MNAQIWTMEVVSVTQIWMTVQLCVTISLAPTIVAAVKDTPWILTMSLAVVSYNYYYHTRGAHHIQYIAIPCCRCK